MFITFISNFFLACVSAALTARYFYSESLAYRLLAFFAFFFSQAILILMSWGLLGRLYPGNIILTAAIVFLLSRLITGKNSPGALFRLPGLSDNRVAAFVLSLLLGFGIVKIIINLVNPPFGWDSLNYHFTFPVEWLKHANLQNPITINDDLAPSYYPINGSLIYLWFILPLKNVFLADVGQIPFFVISFLALYGICRRFSICRRYSLYAATLFSIIPNYFKQIEIAYVDVMVCAWFLISVYFLLTFYQSRKIKDIILFSIALGLLLGTKTLALLYSLLLVVFLILFLLKQRNVLKTSGIVFCLATSIGSICIFGGYGYIRNYVQTKNPVYPMEVRIAEKVVFHGVYDKTNYSVRVSQKDYSFDKLLFHEGLGGGVLLFLIPGLLYLPIGMVRKKIELDKLLLFLTPVFLYLLWRYCVPLANVRYLYPAMALGFVAPFYFLPDTKRVLNTVGVFVVVCIIASVSELASHGELVASLLASLILFFTLRSMLATLERAKVWQWGIIAGVLFVGLFF